MTQGFTTPQVLDTDPLLAANSDYVAPSEKAVRAYVDNLSNAFVSNQVPGGALDGSNKVFTTLQAFATGSLKVYLNGQRLKAGGVDYTEGSSAFTMVLAPVSTDLLLVDYNTVSTINLTGSSSFIFSEAPAGLVNGVNTDFTFAADIAAGSLMLYKNGILQTVGAGNDYTLSARVVTFTTAPATGSVILGSYQSAVSAVANADTLDGQHGDYYRRNRVFSEAVYSSAPNCDSYDIHLLTAQNAGFTVGAMTGTPYQGQMFIFRFKDNATARAITWNAVYRAMGVALPSTTVLSKTLYLSFIYNATDTKWDLIASAQEA